MCHSSHVHPFAQDRTLQEKLCHLLRQTVAYWMKGKATLIHPFCYLHILIFFYILWIFTFKPSSDSGVPWSFFVSFPEHDLPANLRYSTSILFPMLSYLVLSILFSKLRISLKVSLCLTSFLNFTFIVEFHSHCAVSRYLWTPLCVVHPCSSSYDLMCYHLALNKFHFTHLSNQVSLFSLSLPSSSHYNYLERMYFSSKFELMISFLHIALSFTTHCYSTLGHLIIILRTRPSATFSSCLPHYVSQGYFLLELLSLFLSLPNIQYISSNNSIYFCNGTTSFIVWYKFEIY